MKVKNNDIASYLDEIDLLLISSGFEDRSKTLSENLMTHMIKNQILFHLRDNYNIASINRDSIISSLNIVAEDIVNHDKNEPFITYLLFYQKLYQKIEAIFNGRKLNIVIDVTSFSREILLILIKVLTNIEFYKKIKIKFVHTPVENYSNEKDLWLTKGVREIRPIFGYSGLMTPSKKLMLIVLNGFEDERTEIIIEAFEPSALILARPSLSGSINAELKCLADIKYDKIKSKFQSLLLEEIEFSCLEIKNTIDVLQSVYLKYHEKYNIAISPLNNKASTVAVAITAIMNENIQVCYASANQYNIRKQLTPSDYFLVYDMCDYYKI